MPSHNCTSMYVLPPIPRQAAFLELRAISTLSRYLSRIVAKLAEEGSDGTTAVTMTLEAMTMLANPDIALNPRAPLATRLVDDVPSPVEASAMVSALLSCLPHLGSNVTMARNLLASPTIGGWMFFLAFCGWGREGDWEMANR